MDCDSFPSKGAIPQGTAEEKRSREKGEVSANRNNIQKGGERL